MAKKSSKKTQNKELKPEIQDKKEELVFPNTPMVKIILEKDGKEYSVSNFNARVIVGAGRGKLA
jgi:hypothetical protein